MTHVRPMVPEDATALAAVWHEAWHDGHGALLPPALIAIRGLDAFEAAAPRLTHPVLVAELGGTVAGFVGYEGAMIEKLFVARTARGRGVASALMAAAEAEMRAAGHKTAVLDYVAGNLRAARFYAREGWRIARQEDDEIDTPEGPAGFVAVICEKDLGA
ncbi:MAG: GNAT family N-acetyltransferase [Pseudomonadota bacterium]